MICSIRIWHDMYPNRRKGSGRSILDGNLSDVLQNDNVAALAITTLTGDHIKYLVGPKVHTKNLYVPLFLQTIFGPLFTMVPRYTIKEVWRASTKKKKHLQPTKQNRHGIIHRPLKKSGFLACLVARSFIVTAVVDAAPR